jgi:hypothetical protein
MTTVAEQPSCVAANATPWAWLPALAAAGAFGVAEPGDPVVGAAHLEGAGALQVLAFHVHRPGHGLGKHPGMQHGSVRDHIVEQLARGGDVIGTDRAGC